ncbi:DUF4214 domain-containing protein [Bradyrhizobium sp. MOS002]|uniref:beta strand repeat-containing protein n=1 Tax=Bradyrhizobium sp. MOS002 TaxID=2133947 RepID=UPI001304AB69|nr:DUF4214 domain-containing protein [Bradyrhizobium sp. MOS002]
MALSKSDIDLIYLEVLARHASSAEQSTFAALSNSESTTQIRSDIGTLPEASAFVDPIVRLYQGAFGRVPESIDPNGNFDTGAQSGFWVNVNALRTGVTLLALAESFTTSGEFLTLYGSNSVTPALITAYYQHILNRDPSSSEVAAWQATHLDAAQILLGFTQSAEFIAKSQASVDTYKLALASGQHPAGGLPPPPADITLTSDHDLGGVNEGQTVTFTLQSVNPNDFGKTFSYNISGVSAADIVGGSLIGSVTLDAQGLAHVAVTLAADATTEGAEALTLAFGALTDTVTVNDTSLSPTVLTFTSTAGETLVGTDGNDLFKGVVDHSAFNDVGTFQNVIDVAQGGKGFDTLELVVNQSNIDIVPNAPGVEELLVTDLTGANYNLSKMADIKVIASDGSTGGTMNFFNVQNIVNLDIENSDLGLFNMNVTTTVAAGTGAVDMNLVNSGNFNLNYHNSNGDSVVTDWAIHATGADNNINDLHGAGITKTFTIDGSGSLRLDLDNGDDTSGVTSVDASALQGNFTLRDLHANQVDIEGAVGNNDLSMHALGGANVTINTFAGNDTIAINNLNGTDNGQTFNIDAGAGNDQVNINESNSDGDKVTIGLGSGNNGSNLNLGAASVINVSALDGNNAIAMTLHGDPDGAPTFSAQDVTVTVGNGANNVNVNTAADGGGSDQGSKITITAGNGGNVITTNSDDAAVVSIVTGSGADNINATADDGGSKITVNAGDGNNTVVASTDAGGQVSVTTGSGNDTITALTGINAGEGTGASITVNSGAGNDNVSVIWENAPPPVVNVNLGDGDDRVVLLNNQQVTVNTVLDGGNGFDIFANDSAFYDSPTILGTVKNFEALEVTNQLVNNVNAFDFPGSNISEVILDQGWSGDRTISGLDSGSTVAILGDANNPATDDLLILINNAALNIKDVVNLKLADDNGGGNFGHVHLPNIETLNIESTTQFHQAGEVNQVLLQGTGAAEIVLQTLNIAHSATGDVTLDLNGAGGFEVDIANVQAAGFTGGLQIRDDHNGAVTINAPNAGDSNVYINNSSSNTVTLGNGTNTVVTLGGNDTITVGSGSNTIHSGGGVDTINLGAHTSAAQHNELSFDNNTESPFSTPDVVHGFSAQDFINLFGANQNGNNTGIHFAQVTSDAAVIGQISALNNGDTQSNAVFNQTTGHLFIDTDSNGTLDAGDMEINLVGVTNLNASQFHLNNLNIV